MDDETRAPRSADDYMEQIKALLGVNTSPDAFNRVRELVDMRPVVWSDSANVLHVAPLTVRQVVQVIAALEGLTVK